MPSQPAEGESPSNRVPASAGSAPSGAPGDETDARRHLAIHEHELLRRIGRGAYGEVWLARNALGAGRAVKVVYRKDFDDSRPFEREFRGIQKFEPISRSHEGLVNILQVGRHEDYFYYVMELADDGTETQKVESRKQREARITNDETGAPGPVRASNFGIPSSFDLRNSEFYLPLTLREELRAHGRLPAERCVEVGLALTSALAHLHKNGLVHRDIKPSNIILVGGKPKLADIGLVTEAGDSKSIVGTEGYLPPEGPGSPQADIFSLGKVLYEISTGQDRRQFPDLPSDAREWSDASGVLEINQVVLIACTAQAGQRYGTAEEMQKDLARLAGGKSVLRAHRSAQRWRLARRAGVWLGAAAALIGLVTVASRIGQPSAARYIEKRSTNDLANRYFALGRTHFDVFRGTNFQIASDYFQKATNADPYFAPAYSYLAATYFWSDPPWNDGWKLLPQAKTLALKALALDDTLAEPHLALGWYYGMQEWNWREAIKNDQRAVALNGSSSFCHLCYGELLRMAGQTNEALAQMYEARRLDPNSRIINVRLVDHLSCARRFNEALTQIEHGIAMEAAYDFSWDRADILLALGKFDAALDVLRQGVISDSQPKEKVRADIAAAEQALPVERGKAIWRLRLDYEQFPYWRARCYAQLGETNVALDCLEKALKEHDASLTFHIITDWALDPLRSHSRFHRILRTMNFE